MLALEMRKQTIQIYGGKCVCCGEDKYEFLAFDHKDGNGNAHRKTIKASSELPFLRWLKRNNYPNMIRLLCHNCNQSRGFYGYCPHEYNKI